MQIIDSGMAHKGAKIAGAVVGVAVGVTTALNIGGATGNAASPIFPDKTAYFLSHMVGPQLASKVFPQIGGLPGMKLNPLGPLNASVAGGVILLILDGVIHSFIGSKYGYGYIRPVIHGVGAGLIGGGIIGGIFDPPGQTGGLSSNPILGSYSATGGAGPSAIYAGAP